MNYLRQTVTIKETPDTYELGHAFWRVTVPRKWVHDTPGATAFMKKEAPASELAVAQAATTDMLLLFQSAGMLTTPSKEHYTLREVRHLVEVLSTTWHATYYGHPLWNILRRGKLSRNGLLVWALQNYHLSRSAGVTSARAALWSPRADVRALFLHSGMEEYPHCQEYYSIPDGVLGLSQLEFRDVLPGPASTAIDQHMLALAEEDWLAHILLGYLQESTAAHFADCCAFYEDVEKHYGLRGFFDGWKGHIRLDHDYGHASAFSEALDGGETITHADLMRSLNNGLIGAQFIIEALDDVMDEEGADNAIKLRRSFNNLAPGHDNGLLLRLPWLSNGMPQHLDATVADLTQWIVGPSEANGRALTSEEAAFIQPELAYLACRALSYAKEHGTILALGRLTEGMREWLEPRVRESLWVPPTARSAAITNYLRETATTTAEFATCLDVFAHKFGSEPQMVTLFQDMAQVGMNALRCERLARVDRARLATVGTQFAELCASTFDRSGKTLTIDLFR